MNHPNYQRPLNECEAIRAAKSCLGFEWAFENCYYHTNTEADLLLISKARYLTEVEIKLSLSDWNADRKKFTESGFKKGMSEIKNFYYAVPTHLIDKKPEWINPKFGLIEIYADGFGYRGKVIKSADIVNNKRCDRDIIIRLFKGIYYKHSDLRHAVRMKLDTDHSDNARKIYREQLNQSVSPLATTDK